MDFVQATRRRTAAALRTFPHRNGYLFYEMHGYSGITQRDRGSTATYARATGVRWLRRTRHTSACCA
ncbi:hypothetical protein JOE11_002784 [Robbsia andropogonis]